MLRRKKIQVKAILDTDLENLLKKTNFYESIVAGEIHCKNCNTIITIQNIGIVVPQKITHANSFEFYCERIDCTEKYNRNNGN